MPENHRHTRPDRRIDSPHPKAGYPTGKGDGDGRTNHAEDGTEARPALRKTSHGICGMAQPLYSGTK